MRTKVVHPKVTNRELELAALHAVYEEAAFAYIKHQDSPDFVLARKGGLPFGVEITELHESETDARLHRHPEYLQGLWEGGRHMHKDDVTILNAVTVEITDKDGNVKAVDVPAVLRENTGRAPRAQLLNEALQRKEAKFDSYAEGLTHVNVIMLDWLDVDIDDDGSYSVGALLTPELRSALLTTRYREVFTVSETSNGAWIVRPLQMILALETIFLVVKALELFSRDRDIPFATRDVASVMVDTVAGSEMQTYVTDHKGQPAVVYRGVGLVPSEEGVQILDFHDFDPPKATRHSDSRGMSPELMNDWLAFHAQFLSVNDFRTALARPAVRPVWSPATKGAAPLSALPTVGKPSPASTRPT